MGFKWNPLSGTLDYFEENDNTEALSARVLKISLLASEPVSALKAIYQTSPTEGAHADGQNIIKKDVIGISLTSAGIGEPFDVLLFGRIEDSFFNYDTNQLLFLGTNGNIVTIPPTSGHLVRLGKGSGVGAIFVDISEPIAL